MVNPAPTRGADPAARRALLLALAVVSAVLAQWLIDVGSRLAGWVLLGAAVWAFLAALGKTTPSWSLQHLTPPRRVPRVVAWVMATAVAAALFNAAVFDISRPHGVFWFLHAGSIVVALATAVVADVVRSRRCGAPTNQVGSPPAVSFRWFLLLVVTVSALAFSFRFYELTTLPEGFWFDEADHVDIAQQINDDGLRPFWVGGTFAAPGYHAYLIAGVLKLGLGPVEAVRGLSALFGLVAMVGALLVGRELWGRVGAVAALAFVGLSRWPVTVSRVGMFNVVTPACLLLGLGLTLWGLRQDRLAAKMAGGVALGFGLGFHSSMWPGLLGVAGLLVFATLSNRSVLRSLWVPLVGVVVLAAPVAGVAVRDFDLYTERQSEVSLLSSASEDVVADLGANSRAVLGMFTVEGDRNGRHNIPGEPVLDPVAGGLLFLGLGLAARRIAGPVAIGLLLWGFVALVPGAITIPSEAPNALRVIASMPVVYLLAAGALATALRALPKPVVPIGLCLLVIALAGWTTKDYFRDWRDNAQAWAAHSIGETIAAKTAAEAPRDHLVGAIGQYRYSVVAGVLAPDAFDREILDAEVYPLAIPGDADTTLIVGPTNPALIAEHRLVFGDEVLTDYRRDEQLGATVIDLSAPEVRAQQGLVATYRSEAATGAMVRTERHPGGPTSEMPVPLPAEATWEGLLVVEEAGPHRIDLAGAGVSRITIDGEDHPTSDDGALADLDAGPHDIVVEGMVTDPGIVELTWTQPGAVSESVAPRNLWLRPDGPRGLWSQAFGGSEGTGAASRRRLDPAVDFNIGEHDAERPRLIRWTGFVRTPSAGVYTFGTQSTASSTLTVAGYESRSEQRIYLTEGLHPISLEVVDDSPGIAIRLHWTRPGHQMESIPSTALVPPWALSAADTAAALHATAPVVEVDPTTLTVDIADPIAVASSEQLLAVAGAGGNLWVGATDGEGRRLDLGHDITDIDITSEATLAVLDPAGRVLVVDESGVERLLAEDPRLALARGLTVAPDGKLIVAATQDGALFEVTDSGSVLLLPLVAPLSQPVDALVLADGALAVADAEPSSLRSFNGVEPGWSTPLPPAPTPTGPHLARYGRRVFVTHPVLGHVSEHALDGSHVATYRIRSDDDRPTQPVGVAVTSDGVLVVADVAEGRVLSYSLAG